MTQRYIIDYWYCHRDNPVQDIRERPQMLCPYPPHDPATIIRELQAQGYIVQRAELAAVCPQCDGRSTVSTELKSTRRRDPHCVPIACPLCAGRASVAPRVCIYPLPQEPAAHHT